MNSIKLAMILTTLFAISASAQNVAVLRSDVAFLIVCDGKPQGNIERMVEAFLGLHQFKVLNRGELMRQFRGIDLGVHIIGLDANKRTIDFRSLPYPNPENRYSVILRTPPPTTHAFDLEDALLGFSEKLAPCEVRQITRRENGVEARDFYISEIERIDGLFQQADEMRNKTP